MPVSPGSVSGSERAGPVPGNRVLMVGMNWLGDCVMSMPAIQLFRREHGEQQVHVLVKPGMSALWRMHPDVDEVLELGRGAVGLARTVAGLRSRGYSRAYVFPHSFRSALVPFAAGIPERIGLPGHSRDWMLTDVVVSRDGGGTGVARHQSLECMDLLDVSAGEPVLPRIAVPPDAAAWAEARLGRGSRPLVAVMPGAARGPSKRWPAEHFAEVALMLKERYGGTAVALGTEQDAHMCAQVAERAGGLNLVGVTSLAQLAAVLERCSLCLGNDSGGVHLAAAAGSPVVAVFGLTSDVITAPLGRAVRTICGSGQGDRRIARRSAAAEQALLGIDPEKVFDAAVEVLESAE